MRRRSSRRASRTPRTWPACSAASTRSTTSYDAREGHWGYEASSNGHGEQDGSKHAPQAKTAKDPHGRPRPLHGWQRRTIYLAAQRHDKRSQRDPTLQHPRCVFQILRRHFSRYTPEVVSQVCGCTPEEFVRVAELLCANSGRERTTCIVYALGWTQHTTGVQMIRTAGILQLLLGNIGRPGGGIMAMRGHSSIQGSTDIATLYDLLPGYLPQPAADDAHARTGFLRRHRRDAHRLLGQLPQVHRQPAQGVVRRRRHAGERLPLLLAAAHRRRLLATAYFDRMAQGEMKGYFLFGQNPGGGGPNAGLHRAGLRNLDWLVVLDWFETESAVFWKNDPNGPPPSRDQDRGLLHPCRGRSGEGGQLTNTQRLLQWHNKAIDPPGDCRSDSWFVYNLGKRLKQLYAGSTDPKDQPLLNLTWDYDYDEPPRLPDGTISRIEGRAGRREGPHGDERPPARRDRPAHRPASPAERLLGAEGRRHDGVRLLDLQRRLPRAGPQPGGRAQAHRQPAPAGLGLRLAGQPPRPVQPRLGRPRGPALVGAEEAHLVGLPRSDSGSASTSRTSSRTSRPTTDPPPGATGMAAIAGDTPVHHEARRRRLAVRPRRQGRASADALRAGRVAGRQPALSQAQYATRRCAISKDRSTTSPTRRQPSIPWWPPRSGSPSTT